MCDVCTERSHGCDDFTMWIEEIERKVLHAIILPEDFGRLSRRDDDSRPFRLGLAYQMFDEGIARDSIGTCD